MPDETAYLGLAADNPCDDCEGVIGDDYVICMRGNCFGAYCRRCGDKHDLDVHVRARERAILAQWKEQAARKRASPTKEG